LNNRTMMVDVHARKDVKPCIKEAGSHRRLVSVSKLAESRVGVGLVHAGRGIVTVAEVASTSPLEGLIFPGDIISMAPATGSSTRCPTPSVSTPDAVALSAAFFAASELNLNVETPAALVGARSIFLHSSEMETTIVQLGIDLSKDRSGFARVARLMPGSIAAAATGPDALMPGDLITAVSSGGTLHATKSVGDTASRLKLYEGGPIELRIIRREASGSSTCSRPSSARSSRAESDLTAPPAYSWIMASQM